MRIGPALIIVFLVVVFAVVFFSKTRLPEETTDMTVQTISILSPQDGARIQSNDVIVNVSSTNFNAVASLNPKKKGEGYYAIWLDNVEQNGTEKSFIFSNISDGPHVIKAELHYSDNSLYTNPEARKTITIMVGEPMAPGYQCNDDKDCVRIDCWGCVNKNQILYFKNQTACPVDEPAEQGEEGCLCVYNTCTGED